MNEETRLAARDLRGPGWCMLGHMLCMTAIPLAAVSAALTICLHSGLTTGMQSQELLQAALSSDWYEALVYLLNVFCALAALLPFRLYARRRGVRLRLAPGKLRVSRVGALIIMAMGVNVAASLLNVPVELLFNSRGYTTYMDFPMGSGGASRAVMWVYALFIAPCVEEILFRGFLLSGLRRYGERFAVISAAVLFGLMHGNLSQFLSALCIGLLLGCVYVRTGSLALCIAAHAGNNLLALGLEALLPLLGGAADAFSGLFSLGVLICGLSLLRRFLKSGAPLEDASDKVGIQPYRRLYLNPPMLVYLLLTLAEMASAVSILNP